MVDVDLSFKETLKWIFSGLNVKISQFNIGSVHLAVQSSIRSNDTEQLVENTVITIRNSSFSSLDLNPGSKAQIAECYIDAQFKLRPTLITANTSDISIQNCHFGNFINENGSTILYGHNSNVMIDNSVFIQHNSSKGVLLMQNNCYMRISGSSISQNVASSLLYSSITLNYGIHADVNNTVFRNNSALVGGALFAENQCNITLTNCTFSSNKAITGKTRNIPKTSNVKMATRPIVKDNIGTYFFINQSLFNNTASHDKNLKVMSAHQTLLLKTSTLNKKSTKKEGHLHSMGGAVYVVLHSQLVATNCVFEDNAAEYGAGAIAATANVTLNVQETAFVGNKAFSDGGAIIIQHQAQLRITNCVFDDNRSQRDGGAIFASFNTTLYVQETTFVGNRAQDAGAIASVVNTTLEIHQTNFIRNRAVQLGRAILATINVTVDVQKTTFVDNKAFSDGGAIFIQQQAQLRITNCEFDDNISERLGGTIVAGGKITLEIQKTNFTRNSALMQGGAISAIGNVTVDVQETNFVGNKAFSDGGAISIQQQADFRMTNCVFDDNLSERLGGAISAGGNITLDIQETNFIRNRAEQGGAIDIDRQSLLRITNCTFEDNHAKLGGALFGGLNLVCEIIESQFLKNSASQQGGAINVQENANLLIVNTILEHNFADTDQGGGIMVTFNVKSQIRQTNFTANSAPNTAGALMVNSQTECHIQWCIFHSNTANTFGGAVGMSAKSSLKIENTNFTNNNSTDGGAIAVDSNSKLQTKTCIFLKNFAKQTGGAIKLEDGATAKIESCCFLGNHAENGGAVNFNAAHQPYLRATFFLRNVASNSGGAITINQATNAIINNITCVGNRSPRGGCLYVGSVVLTLYNSDISQNFGYEIGAGILADYSRMQVGSGILNGGKSTLWNVISVFEANHSYFNSSNAFKLLTRPFL